MSLLVEMMMGIVMKTRETGEGTSGYIGVESLYLGRAHDILQKL